MGLHDDLLDQAEQLATREPKRPKQASLRRAVSTSYYALFHLLISEATLNWRQSSQRAALGRYFQHGSMAKASDKQKADCNSYQLIGAPDWVDSDRYDIEAIGPAMAGRKEMMLMVQMFLADRFAMRAHFE